MHCKHCNRDNHNTADCIHLGKSKCSTCGKFGHTSDKCWGKDRRKKEEGKDKPKKRQKKEETNEGEEQEDEEIITLNTEEIEDTPSSFFDSSKEGQLILIVMIHTI